MVTSRAPCSLCSALGVAAKAGALINGTLALDSDICEAILAAFDSGLLSIPYCLHPDNKRGAGTVLDANNYYMGFEGARVENAFSFLSALRQDPVLCGVKLIAEPWDIGPGGYRLGGFPHPFSEWNDRFRDGLRRFWRGDAGQMPELARRISGSAEVFDHAGRPATASLNFLTAHDGFTLQDLVAFNEKHNEANGEANRDGHNENYSQALTDPEAQLARKRALLATLMISQGVPMLLGGDEIGNSQGGNNNAYAQDNPIGWIDWKGADMALAAFVGRLPAIRRAHPVLRQRRFLHAKLRAQDGMRHLIWWRPDGIEPSQRDWLDAQERCLCAEIRGAAEGYEGEAAGEAVFVICNAGEATEAVLPPGRWTCLLDTARPDAPEAAHPAAVTCVAAQSVQLFARPTAQEEHP